MREAYKEASYAVGFSDPNPAVGAVLVDPNGRILGKGFSQKAGSSHAEVMAIKEAQKKTGSKNLDPNTLYVSLEPCCHYGRTPPVWIKL